MSTVGALAANRFDPTVTRVANVLADGWEVCFEQCPVDSIEMFPEPS